MSKIVFFVKKYLVLVITFLLTLFLFYPYFIAQKAPLALDIPIGMYYPWYNHTYGYAVRPPVKNPILTDTVSQFWIWRNRAVKNLMAKQEVTWNPYSLSGYNMSSWFHSILFSPLNIFYAIAPQVDAMSLIVISQVTISFIATYFFAKTITNSSPSGYFMAIVWSLSSFFVGWLTWGTVSFALALLPAILYLWELAYIQNKTRLVRVTAIITLVFLVLSGHPQTTAYVFFILFSWAVFKIKSFKAVQDIFIGIIINLPLISPSFSVITSSIRNTESLSSVNNGLIPWAKILATLITPNFFGNPATNNYFGADYNFQEKLVYFGFIPLVLSTYVLIRLFYQKKVASIVWLAIFYLVIGFLVSTDKPLGWAIYQYKLPIISTSPAGRGFIIAIFGFVLLSTYGFKDLLSDNLHKRSLALSVLVWFVTLLLTSGILVALLYFIKQSPDTLDTVYQAIKQNSTISLRNIVYPFIFLICFVVLYLLSRISFLRNVSFFLILLLTLSDSYLFFKKYTPFVPKNLLFPTTPTTDFLVSQAKNSPDIFRIERESAELLPPNMWEVFGLRSTSGYDPMAPISYENYLLSSKALSGLSRYVENAQVIDKLDPLGIKYLLVLKRDQRGVADKDGKIPYFVDQKKWQAVFSEGPVSVLENKKYQPPYFISSSVSGEINLLSRSDGEYTFQVSTAKDAKFIFLENFDIGWHARVNGELVTLEKYNNTFLSIPVYSGNNIISLKHGELNKNQNLYTSLIFLLIAIYYVFILS